MPLTVWPWHTQRVCCYQNHGGKSRTKEGHTASVNYARKQKRMNLKATGRIIGSARTFTSRLLLQSYCHRWMKMAVTEKRRAKAWNDHEITRQLERPHMLISSSTTKSLSSPREGRRQETKGLRRGRPRCMCSYGGHKHTKQRPVQKGIDPPQWFIEALIIQVYINRSTVNSGRSLRNLQALK